MLDWVTGAGFEQVSRNWNIGDSLSSAEGFRKEQEEFEKATKVRHERDFLKESYAEGDVITQKRLESSR